MHGQRALAAALLLAATCTAAEPTRDELLQQAEAALSRGAVFEALRGLDRAAALEHASDIELGLVRAYMQLGHYRRAMAFAAHTAGTHRDDARGAVLYAWLLAAGGQGAFAQRQLDEADARLPGHALLAEGRRQLGLPAPMPSAALLQAPARLAPYSAQVELPAGARMVATGTLIDDGGHALVPAGALGGATAAWVRDGLGRIASARVVRRIEPLELALLRLEAPLPAAGEVVLHERDAFPGTPAYAVEYASRDGDEAAPAWPWLRTGFLGMPDGVGGLRRLGVQMPPGPRGGPVFDTGGRLVGISVPGDRLVVASLLRAHLGKLVDAVPAPAASRVPLDAVYENAMRVAVQVVVAAP